MDASMFEQSLNIVDTITEEYAALQATNTTLPEVSERPTPVTR